MGKSRPIVLARKKAIKELAPRDGMDLAKYWADPCVRRGLIWSLLLGLVCTLCAAWHQERMPWRAGHVLDEARVSRVDFEHLDRKRIETRREMEAERIPPYFRANEELREKLLQDLLRMVTLHGAVGSLSEMDEIQHQEAIRWRLTDSMLARLSEQLTSDRNAGPQWLNFCEDVTNALFREVIISKTDYQQIRADLHARHYDTKLRAVHPDPITNASAEMTRMVNRIWRTDRQEDLYQVQVQMRATVGRTAFPDMRPAVMTIIERNLDLHEVTYHFDPEATQLHREAASNELKIERTTLRVGDLLAPVGKLDTTDIFLLQREHAVARAQASAELSPLGEPLPPSDEERAGRWRLWLPPIGVGLLCALLTAMLAFSLAASAPRILKNPMRAFALGCLMALGVTLSVWLGGRFPAWLGAAMALAPMLTVMVIAVAYDRRVAMTVTLTLVLCISCILHPDPGTLVALILAPCTASLLLSHLEQRSQLVVAGLSSGTVMAAALFCSAALQMPAEGAPDGWWSQQTANLSLSLLICLACAVSVQAALPLIERVFHITTAMTLQELNNTSHPLLKRLAEKAPGTYQHSLRIADISEAAARAIDADALLCRVGAMYHDVGKANKPEFFVENQQGGINRHDETSPIQSARIIQAHVKDGIAMAHEHRLPEQIIHCIAGHHGTTLIEYFFHKAQRAAKEQGGEAPNEFSYRYPGPKPQTREVALLMICDALESASRTLPEHTPARIAKLVKTIIDKRLQDGQLDECPLTLQDPSHCGRSDHRITAGHPPPAHPLPRPG